MSKGQSRNKALSFLASPATGPTLCLSNAPSRRANSAGRGMRATRIRMAACLSYGALDLGTNNCRLLVARPSRRGFQVIDAFSRIIRLGEGVSQTGRLSEAAMVRTMEALKVCSEKMERRNVHRSRLIATEACRVAANGGDFVCRVRQETGLAIEVISRETEARLAVAGCASLLDRNCDWALVFDIGGGSTELIWLDLRRLNSGKRQADRRPRQSAGGDRSLDVAARRRGHSGRKIRRPDRRYAAFRGDGRGCRGEAAAFREGEPAGAACGQGRRPSHGNVRHGDDDRGRPSARWRATAAARWTAAG